jgi:hypothetical protein
MHSKKCWKRNCQLDLLGRRGKAQIAGTGISWGILIARYKKLFRSSPEAPIFAVYGMVHLILLLAAAEVEQVKSLIHALGFK